MKHTELNTAISNLIELLDIHNDSLLIDMLKNKINNSYEMYLKKYFLTEKELRRAKQGASIILNTHFINEYSNTNEAQKINKILKNNDCEICKYSVNLDYIYKTQYLSYKTADKTDRCSRCINRCEKLNNIYDKKKDNIYNLNDKTLLNQEEIIKTKAIINKLTKKLKTYDASKH